MGSWLGKCMPIPEFALAYPWICISFSLVSTSTLPGMHMPKQHSPLLPTPAFHRHQQNPCSVLHGEGRDRVTLKTSSALHKSTASL